MFNKGYLGFSFEDIYCIYKEAFFIVLNRGELAMDKGPINVYTQVNLMKSSIAKYNNLSIDSLELSGACIGAEVCCVPIGSI